MDRKIILQNRFLIFILIIGLILIPGCIEVTPSAGSGDASSYGPAGENGDGLSAGERGEGQQSPESTQPGSSSQDQGSDASINPALPDVPGDSVIPVQPVSTQGLTSRNQQYSKLYERSGLAPDQQYLPIYSFNKTFNNEAVAFAYNLTTPPLFIDLTFAPNMTTDIIAHEKRTGDKEGMIEHQVNRPSQDAWFEIRVYNRETGEEVLNEGFGRSHSLENKSVRLQRGGSYQFDMLGDKIHANVTMKLAINEATLQRYVETRDAIEAQKSGSGGIPPVFLVDADLPPAWIIAGDPVQTVNSYSSAFIIPDAGYRFQQDVSRYQTPEEAKTKFQEIQSGASADTPSPLVIGDDGYGYETNVKSGIVYLQGPYLVQVTSYSYPLVMLDDLKGYGTIISGRIRDNL